MLLKINELIKLIKIVNFIKKKIIKKNIYICNLL